MIKYSEKSCVYNLEIIHAIFTCSIKYCESISVHKLQILSLQSATRNCPAGTDAHCYCVLQVLAPKKEHVGLEPSMCRHVLAKSDDNLPYFVS